MVVEICEKAREKGVYGGDSEVWYEVVFGALSCFWPRCGNGRFVLMSSQGCGFGDAI